MIDCLVSELYLNFDSKIFLCGVKQPMNSDVVKTSDKKLILDVQNLPLVISQKVIDYGIEHPWIFYNNKHS